MRDPDLTLAGGPTTVRPRVLAALGKPITHHRAPSFPECFRRTQAKVGLVFGTANEIIRPPGEAPLGLEAAARCLVCPGMPAASAFHPGCRAGGARQVPSGSRCRNTNRGTA